MPIRRFSKFKKNILLINTSRGGVVDTIALLESNENKQVKGACLDVFENEKPITYSTEEEKWYEHLLNNPKFC